MYTSFGTTKTVKQDRPTMLPVRKGGGAVFVGIAKNVFPFISQVLLNVEECGFQFEERRFIIVENNSTDGTQEALHRWASAEKGRIYIRAADVPSEGWTRTERLAYFRNIYLTEIEKDEYNTFEYVVVFDCDNIISSWVDQEAFNNSIEFLVTEEKAAAVFANTRGFYYDVWTLRHPIWCPGDCWDEVQRVSAFISHTEAVLSCVGARQVRLGPTSAPIPVTSAFGGLAVYKKKYLLGKRYSAKNADGSPACEHVPLNQSISADGGKLFIFPQLLVRTPYEHIHRARDKLYYRTRVVEHLKEWRRHLELSFFQFFRTLASKQGGRRILRRR